MTDRGSLVDRPAPDPCFRCFAVSMIRRGHGWRRFPVYMNDFKLLCTQLCAPLTCVVDGKMNYIKPAEAAKLGSKDMHPKADRTNTKMEFGQSFQAICLSNGWQQGGSVGAQCRS